MFYHHRRSGPETVWLETNGLYPILKKEKTPFPLAMVEGGCGCTLTSKHIQ